MRVSVARGRLSPLIMTLGLPRQWLGGGASSMNGRLQVRPYPEIWIHTGQGLIGPDVGRQHRHRAVATVHRSVGGALSGAP